MTVTVRPYARSPYSSNLLYTPTYSRHLTIAKGVHGRIDLTIPFGRLSSFRFLADSASRPVVDEISAAESNERGEMNRML